MQLTEKNIMVGDWLNYRISDDKWKPMQAGIDTLKGLISFKEEMNERVRPIPLTEDVLSKIEGVECIVLATCKKWRFFDFLEVVYDKFNAEFSFHFGEDYSLMPIDNLHQLQQLSRCLGHELVINFLK